MPGLPSRRLPDLTGLPGVENQRSRTKRRPFENRHFGGESPIEQLDAVKSEIEEVV